MKRMDIEALLRWTYRDELPKAAAHGGDRLVFGLRSGWGGVERYGELLAVVQEPDIRNRYGLVPDGSDGEPHPDAIAVHDAVERLGQCVFDLPDGWDPLADMGGAGAFGAEGWAALAQGRACLTSVDATGRVVLRRSPARLVIRQAILGGAADWEGEVPVRRVVTGANGRPKWWRRVVQVSDGAFGPVRCEVEVDGIDAHRRIPHPDAYQRFVLDPDLAPVVRARAEYEIWVAALGLLVEDLAGRLTTCEEVFATRTGRPWEGQGDAQAGRVLPSLLSAPSRDFGVTGRAGGQNKVPGAA